MVRQRFALINYHNIESAQALRLAVDLKNKGVNVWLDRLDLDAQADWLLEFDKHLDECSAFIPLLSPDYVASNTCIRALQIAEQRQVPIVGVLWRAFELREWPRQVDHKDLVDWTDVKTEADYQALITHLVERLSATQIDISPFVRSELRHLNQQLANIEIQRSRLDYVGLSHVLRSKRHTEPLNVPLSFEPKWGLGGTFIYRGVAWNETRYVADLRQFAQDNPVFILLGGVGVGKTTSLQRLAIEAAWAYRTDSQHLPLPCYISLAHWTPEMSLLDLLKRYSPFKDVPQALAQGRLALFLDGLDALGSHQVAQRQELLNFLASAPAEMRVVITCDKSHLEWALAFHVPLLSLEPLTERLSNELITRLLDESNVPKFYQLLQPSEQWAWLTRNCLMLRCALLSMGYFPSAPLPPTPTLLVLNVIEQLWTREQMLQNPSWVALESALPPLAEMALDMLSSGQGYSASLAYARSFFTPPSVCDVVLNSGILVAQDERVIFLHPIFQAVLAAWHLQHSDQSVHNYLMHPVLNEQGLRVPQIMDEVLMALAGLVPVDREDIQLPTYPLAQAFTSSLLDDIANVDPYLAAQAVDRGVPCHDAVRQFIALRLVQQELQTPSMIGYERLNRLLNGQVGTFLHALLREAEPHLRLNIGKLLLMWRENHVWRYLEDLVTRLQQPERDLDAQVMSWRAMGVDALATLMSRASSPAPQERQNIAWMLGELADRAAVPTLLQMLEDADLQVSAQAAISLGHLRDPLSLKPLLDRLQHPDLALRRALVMALGAMGNVALPALLDLLKQGDASLRRIVAGVLGRIGDVSAISSLIEGLQDPAPPVRAMCALALSQIRHPMVDRIALRPLARLFSDEQPARWTNASVGEIALRAVEKIGTESAMNFVKLWRERQNKPSTSAPSSPSAVDKASADLAHMRLTADKQRRIESLQSPNPPVSQAKDEEASVLESFVTPQPFSPIENPLPFDEFVPVESFISVEQMVQSLASSDSATRNQAARQLSDYAKAHRNSPNNEAWALIEGLSSPEWFVRWSVIEALAWWPDVSALPYLLNAFNDDNWTVRLAVVRALVELKDVRAIPNLLQHLKNSQEHDLVRETCAEALGLLQDKRVVDDLLLCLYEVPVHFIRLAVLRALERLDEPKALKGLEAFSQTYQVTNADDDIAQLLQKLITKYRQSAEI